MWKSNRIAELVGHPVEFHLHCGCKGLRVVRAEWFISHLGQAATVELAERRMICRLCKQRPRFEMKLQWSVSGGRDRRPNPPPLPEWARFLR
jgi:hypothetical protein